MRAVNNYLVAISLILLFLLLITSCKNNGSKIDAINNSVQGPEPKPSLSRQLISLLETSDTLDNYNASLSLSYGKWSLDQKNISVSISNGRIRFFNGTYYEGEAPAHAYSDICYFLYSDNSSGLLMENFNCSVLNYDSNSVDKLSVENELKLAYGEYISHFNDGNYSELADNILLPDIKKSALSIIQDSLASNALSDNNMAKSANCFAGNLSSDFIHGNFTICFKDNLLVDYYLVSNSAAYENDIEWHLNTAPRIEND